MNGLQPAAYRWRLPAVAVAALASVALLEPAAAEQTSEQRIERLEAQIRALTDRVAGLEADRSAAAAEDRDAPWLLGDDLRGSPFRIVHKTLDADRGRVELLLQITAPVAAPERWMPGGPAPIRLTLTAPDGRDQSLYMTLLRGASFEPGKHLHLLAELDPSAAAAASRLQIEHIR